MDLLPEIAMRQIVDPFRIGLVLFLVATTLRNSRATGFVIPLALGIAFVAVLIPGTMGQGEADLAAEIGVGLVVNLAWAAVMMGAWALLRRLRGAGA